MKRKMIAKGLILAAVALSANLCSRLNISAAEAQSGELQTTATITPTTTRTITATATQAYAEFTLANINSVAPSDVMAEMFVFAQGGGEGLFRIPEICQPSPYRISEVGELMEATNLRVCWPEANDLVIFKVMKPDGRVDLTVLHSKDGKVEVKYQPRYNDPVGEYVLRLSGSKSSMEIRVRYGEPWEPRLMDLPGSPFAPVDFFEGSPQRNLILDHFVPGEKVRLFAYETSGWYTKRMTGWRTVIIRGDGTLPVRVDLATAAEKREVTFVAVGEKSGEVELANPGGNLSLFPLPVSDLTCPGAMPTRLSAGMSARAARTDGRKLRVHQTPGLNAPTVALLPEGTEMMITTFGADCKDHIWFWSISWGDGKFGWAAEADQNAYLIEPLP